MWDRVAVGGIRTSARRTLTTEALDYAKISNARGALGRQSTGGRSEEPPVSKRSSTARVSILEGFNSEDASLIESLSRTAVESDLADLSSLTTPATH